MITVSLAKQPDLKEFAKIRLLAHKYSAQFDKNVIISKDTPFKLAELTKKEFKDQRMIYLLAREGSELLGIAIISIATDIDRAAFLGELFVKEEYRQKGVGRKLIETAEEIVKKKGLNKLHITVAGNNKKAQNFYHNFGFYRKKRDYILLEKNLA